MDTQETNRATNQGEIMKRKIALFNILLNGNVAYSMLTIKDLKGAFNDDRLPEWVQASRIGDELAVRMQSAQNVIIKRVQ
jgi:hypothetical protein